MINTDRPVKGKARAAILEAADRLFYRDGVRWVGVDTVAAEAGITKRTLYYHFSNKDALVAAYLTARDQTTRNWIAKETARFGPLPGDQILGIFDVFASWFAEPDYYGCPYLSAVAQSAGKTETVIGGVLEHKDAVRDWIASKLTDAGATSPQGLSEQMMLLVDGALSRSLIYRGPDIAHHAHAAAASLLRAAGVPVTQNSGD